MAVEKCFVVLRNEGMYETSTYVVRVFASGAAAGAFRNECESTWKVERERFEAYREKKGDAWYYLDSKKSDAIARRYERRMADQDVGLQYSSADIEWHVAEVPFVGGLPSPPGGSE